MTRQRIMETLARAGAIFTDPAIAAAVLVALAVMSDRLGAGND
jgi:hypothetical protein